MQASHKLSWTRTSGEEKEEVTKNFPDKREDGLREEQISTPLRGRNKSQSENSID